MKFLMGGVVGKKRAILNVFAPNIKKYIYTISQMLKFVYSKKGGKENEL